jgi:trk system potassium uptake protein TrkH
MRSGKTILNPARIILLGYVAIIVVGAFLLSLPVSTHESHSVIDSLFTSTSSICVTGLIVKSTPDDFTRFGKTIILLLIQLGGLGYMTIASLLFLVLGKRLSIRQSTMTEEAMTYPFGGIGRFVLQVVKLTVGFEVAGAIILSFRFASLGMSPSDAIFKGLFHSVSAFCNAGFALFSGSLVPFARDPLIILVMSGLIIVGGLGFIVLRDLYQRARRERSALTLHTKLVLLSTGALLVSGTIFVLAAEWRNVLGELPFGCKFLCGFFQSVTARTAGFQVVNVGDYKLGTRLVTAIFMFIGASPGGTGGGIKTTTALLILMSAYAYFRGKRDVGGLGRRVENSFVMRSVAIACVSVLILGTCVLILSFSEEGKSFIALFFEGMSALGTVGLSVGSSANPACSLSHEFTNVGKIVIILTMLAGRVGSLTIGTALIKAVRAETFRLPKGVVLTG